MAKQTLEATPPRQRNEHGIDATVIANCSDHHDLGFAGGIAFSGGICLQMNGNRGRQINTRIKDNLPNDTQTETRDLSLTMSRVAIGRELIGYNGIPYLAHIEFEKILKMSCSCGFELYGIPPKGTVRKSPLKASREPRARHFVRSAYDSKKSSKRQQGLVFSFQNPRVRVSSSVHSAALPGGRDLPNDDKTREEEVSAKSESELKKSVDAALRRGSFEEFLKVLQLATSRGANLNRVFRWRMMRPALELCVRQGSVNQGLHVAGALGPKFEMAAVNIFADAYAQAGRHQQVRQLLDSLASQPPLRADERTYVALIKAYSRDGRADLALKVPKEMAGQRLEVNVHVYCALLNATAKDVATAQQAANLRH
eukprot:gene24561-29876_t